MDIVENILGKKIIFKGQMRTIERDNIPTYGKASLKGPSNDYKGKCPYCHKWFQTDDSTMYGDFIVCPHCGKAV